MKKILIAMSLIVILILLMYPLAASDLLDEIESYIITVDMFNDGTAQITYDIRWKVLNDKNKNEPLTWVKIGVPNEYYEILSCSDNVTASSYKSDGEYVRLDLDEKYYAGEVADFSFCIHQKRLYSIDTENGICKYVFTPGWFEDIEVKKITVKWSDAYEAKCDTEVHQDEYYIWESSLLSDEKLTIEVNYEVGSLNVSYEESVDNIQESENSVNAGVVIIVLLVIIFIVFLIMVIFGANDNDDDSFGSGNGMGGSSYHRTNVYVVGNSLESKGSSSSSSGSRSGSGGSSRGGGAGRRSSCVSSCACVSCACACACAGGGRAGCSKKEFYSTKTVDVEQLNKINNK